MSGLAFLKSLTAEVSDIRVLTGNGSELHSAFGARSSKKKCERWEKVSRKFVSVCTVGYFLSKCFYYDAERMRTE
jgi:hypothetical protein